MPVTLRDVYAITGSPTIDCDVVNNLKDVELTCIPTLNAAPSVYTRLCDDVSTAKKLSLEEENKYFLWSFLINFIFCPSRVKPIMDLYSIVATISFGNQFSCPDPYWKLL